MEHRQVPQDKSGVLGRTPFEHVGRLCRREIFEQQYTLSGFGPQYTVLQARRAEGDVSCHVAIKAELPFVYAGMKHGRSNIRIGVRKLKLRDDRRGGAGLGPIVVESDASELPAKTFPFSE